MGPWMTRLEARATRERCWSWRRECSAGLVGGRGLAGGLVIFVRGGKLEGRNEM